MNAKSELHIVLNVFLQFVQTEFSSKLKEFLSDGGTEFLNSCVKQISDTNGTHHRNSFPYTPQQNGCVE